MAVILAMVVGGAVPAVAAAGFLDTSFADPAVDGSINAVVLQSDGKVLVGGSFTSVRGLPRRYLARFNADGSLDTAFDPDPDNEVLAIRVQDDGQILIGGFFTTMGGQTRERLARLNPDGTPDSFNPGVGYGGVRAITLQADGKILVGGSFGGLGGQTRPYMARLDQGGAVDAFNPAPNGEVSAIAVQGDGMILIAGSFSMVDGQSRFSLARLDAGGVLDTSFNPQPSNSVVAIALQADGKILVGGSFVTMGGQTRRGIARLDPDGTVDGFIPPRFGFVGAIGLQDDGKVLAAGSITSGGPTRNSLARLNADGSLDTAFSDPNLSSSVAGIAVDGTGRIWIGGYFETAGPLNTPYKGLARFFSTLHTLSLTAPANGSVTSSPGGLDCGANCMAELGPGTQVSLTATPALGYGFAGWGGGCTGSANPLTITLLAGTACTASFTATGSTPPPPPAPLPSFVSAPLPASFGMPAGGSASGSVSFAGAFVNPQALGFTATLPGGAALPSWLSFDPATATFRYTAPIPADLPFQPAADADGRAGTEVANAIYPPRVRVAQVPVTFTATGAGQSYATTVQMSFYAPRPPVARAAVSLSLDGVPGNGRSGRSALSWDGGQVVFETASSNLFPAAPNAHPDIVRYHGLSGDRDRLSQTAIPGGGVANAADGASVNPAVSSDGRYGAFASDATGIALVASGGKRQVYRTALGYPRVPLDGKATPAPDLVSVTAAGVVGNGASDNPALSQDGRYVVFDSTATNFTAGLDGTRLVWRKDLATGALVQVAAGRTPAISWDGRWVTFEADGSVYLRDMTTASSQIVGRGNAPKLSARGDRVVFTNAGKVMLGSQAIADGDQPDLSADGRFVVYRSAAGQIVVHDVDRGVGAPVTQTTTGASWNPAISGDGGTISFASNARDLVPGNPAAGQLYLAANPLPLPGKTGYRYTASASGQGWAIERWGNKAYVGGLAYDAQGRGQWLAGLCTLSGLSCTGTLTHGPAFTLADTSLTVGNAPALALTPFPIGGARTTAYAGLPQTGWWYDPAAHDGIGYFLGISTQPQPDGGVAQVGYLAVLAYDPAGRQVWQTAQAPFAADLSFTGMLTQYVGGASFGSAGATMTASGTAVGQVRLIFDGTDRARISLPSGRSADLVRFRF